MTETLNRCFTELLAVAYADGAGLVKWGGDAVLLLFTGPEHAGRASRAAIGMQGTLPLLRRLRTSAGAVRLEMSVGIHSDRYDFFLVGSRHRDLVVAGQAATTAVEMEAIAKAGEVVISNATAGQLDPSLIGARRGGGHVLLGAPDVHAEGAPEIKGVENLDLELYLPPELARHIRHDSHESEHRAVAIAFVELARTDDLIGSYGPDALAEALHERLSNVEEVAHRYAIPFFQTDVSRSAVKIILIAGAPVSAGKEEERMLRAAREIVDWPGVLPLRIGVHCGRVFAGSIGPPYRRTYTAYGDAVNTAARLMSSAELNQIVASKTALDRAHTSFDLDELEPLVLKGKGEPVEAAIVGRRAGSRARPSSELPFVGRERELAAVEQALDAVRSGTGQIVQITGEPGSGKSRFVEELRRRAGDIPVYSEAAEEYGGASAYGVVGPFLRQVLGIPADVAPAHAEAALHDSVRRAAPDLVPWLPLIGMAVGIEVPHTEQTRSLDDRFFQQRLIATIVRLLGAMLPSPTLLVFEDVNWMDEGSHELLRAVSAAAAEHPWLVVLTGRTDAAHLLAETEAGITISLEPLGAAEAVALLRASAGETPIAPHEAEALVERSGGNPFFLTELVSATLSAAGEREALPDSLEALLSAQIDRLAPGDRTVLRYAATIGSRFDIELLIEALPPERASLDAEVWGRLAEFIHPEQPGALRFRHALVRDAAYEGLPYRRRRSLHARIAETIERLAASAVDDQSALLSLHYFSAQRFDKAWHYSRLAAERARSVHAQAEAAVLYERALKSARRLRSIPPLEIGQVAEALGDVRLRLGELEQAASAYRLSRARLDADAVRRASLLLKEGLIRWRLGRYPQSLRWLHRGMDALVDLEGHEAAAQRARLAAWYAVVRQKQGRPKEAIGWCERAIDDARGSGADDALAHAYYILDWAYMALGEPAKATYSAQALAIYERLGDLEKQAGVLNNLGAWAYFAGRWTEALELYDRARTASETIGDTWSGAFARHNVAEILSDQGHLDEAATLFDDALRVLRASGAESFIASGNRERGELEARRGHFVKAKTLLDRARARNVQDGDEDELLMTDACIAEYLLLAGDPAAALAHTTDTLAHSAAAAALFAVTPRLLRVRGLALRRLGKLREAREVLEQALHAARERTADYEIGLVLEALIDDSNGERATLVTERDAIFDRLGVIAIGPR